MRLLFGGFLIVSGLAMAAVGLERTPTSVSHTDPPPSKPKSATSGEPLNASVSTIVTLPVRSRAPEVLVTSFTATAPVAGAELVSELQRELTRVECYDGPVNGHWSAQTRRAMSAFLERANAKLPTDQADGVLLALVKHHSGAACGSCPLGHQPSANGRCVPEAIAARVASYQSLAHPSVDPVADSLQTSRRTRRRAQIEGRMGVGSPPIVAKPSNQVSRIAEAQPPLPDERPAVRQRREKRAARHVNRRLASHSRGYLRPMRAPRYAYRPRGIAASLFGWF
jgi:peptidoglycan hydrolase-like protein with peptidoglycan-binding domain